MKRSAPHENKSLKTFLIYGSIVLFFILVSLLIKTIFVIQASKFDGDHQFILSIYQNNRIGEVIKFNPPAREISVVQVKDDDIGVIPDGKVDSNFDLPLGTNVAQTMKMVGFKYTSLTTNLTLLDIIRLTMFSYKTPVESVSANLTKSFFIDETISAENISVQIINASGVSGMGKRLENILSNLGYNVVSITTSREEAKSSKIKYFDKKTYASEKLQKILEFPLEKTDKEGIADIVIIIGENSRNKSNF